MDALPLLSHRCSPQPRRLHRLDRQMGAARALPFPRRHRLGPSETRPHRRPVPRCAAGEGAVPQARARRPDPWMTTDAEVEDAVTNAPDGTRAFLRSVAVARLGEDLVAASWDSLVLNAGDLGVVRLPMHEPLK